jgi:hypothetical protein
VCNAKLWEKYRYDKFPDALLKMFDSPFKVWEHAFENQITDLAKLVLYSLLIGGRELKMHDLHQQFKHLTVADTPNHDPLLLYREFRKAVKELDNSFIQIHQNNGVFFVRFHNPSIQDFLIDYTDQDADLKSKLIKLAIYIKPSLLIFSNNKHSSHDIKRFDLTPELIVQLKHRVINNFDDLLYSPEIRSDEPSAVDLIALKLDVINQHLGGLRDTELIQFIVNRFTPILYSTDLTNTGLHAYSRLLMYYFSEEPEKIDVETILLHLKDIIWSDDDFTIFGDFDAYFPDQFNEFREKHDDEYQDTFAGHLEGLSETTGLSVEEIKENQEALKELENLYEISVDTEQLVLSKAIERLERIKEQEEYEEENYDFYKGWGHEPSGFYRDRDDEGGGRRITLNTSSEERIEDLFRSMKYGPE